MHHGDRISTYIQIHVCFIDSLLKGPNRGYVSESLLECVRVHVDDGRDSSPRLVATQGLPRRDNELDFVHQSTGPVMLMTMQSPSVVTTF